MIDWNRYFDAIYCIHFLPKHEERHERISSELKRVGILDSDVFHWKYTVDNPFYCKIQQAGPWKHTGPRDQKSVFNCGFAHYEIYKEAEALKYNRIMVIEEDAVFLKDLQLLEKIVQEIPDTDVVLFDKFVYDPKKYMHVLQDNNRRISNFFSGFDGSCGNFGSTACYSLNSSAIKAFSRQQEQEWYCADELWNDWKTNTECNALSKSFARLNLCYQKSFGSSIHDNIELAYRFIGLNKELYN